MPKAVEQIIDANANDACIELESVTCYWDHVDRHLARAKPNVTDGSSGGEGKMGDEASPHLLALSDVSIQFLPGELTFVIGRVGSGKSALLQAVAGELPVRSGKLHRRRQRQAYASQDPWIMDGTVRENIILGHEYNPRWYGEVVAACGLTLDFEQWVAGDKTIVGDRGVQCSGGQRARIGLARALYSDPDVLVADDPLSAVDAKVGRTIFEEAVLRLMIARGKCVLLASHQHQYIGGHRCVLMANGSIDCIGSYDECIKAAGGKLTGHMSHTAVDTLGANDAKGNKQSAGRDEKADEDTKQEVDEAEDRKEERVEGDVRLQTYVAYARAMGSIWLAFFMLALFSATQACVLVCFAAMGKWAERRSLESQVWLCAMLSFCSMLFVSHSHIVACAEIMGHRGSDSGLMRRDDCSGNNSSQEFLHFYGAGVAEAARWDDEGGSACDDSVLRHQSHGEGAQ